MFIGLGLRLWRFFPGSTTPPVGTQAWDGGATWDSAQLWS